MVTVIACVSFVIFSFLILQRYREWEQLFVATNLQDKIEFKNGFNKASTSLFRQAICELYRHHIEYSQHPAFRFMLSIRIKLSKKLDQNNSKFQIDYNIIRLSLIDEIDATVMEEVKEKVIKIYTKQRASEILSFMALALKPENIKLVS